MVRTSPRFPRRNPSRCRPSSPIIGGKSSTFCGLSPQQAQILDLLLRGVGDENIAPTVGLRKSTVRADIAHLFRATRANNRTELAMQVLALAHQVKPTRGEAIFCGSRLF